MNKKCICAAVAVMLSASAAAARTPVMENAEMFRAVPEQNVVDRPLQLPNPIKEHTYCRCRESGRLHAAYVAA